MNDTYTRILWKKDLEDLAVKSMTANRPLRGVDFTIIPTWIDDVAGLRLIMKIELSDGVTL